MLNLKWDWDLKSRNKWLVNIYDNAPGKWRVSWRERFSPSYFEKKVHLHMLLRSLVWFRFLFFSLFLVWKTRFYVFVSLEFVLNKKSCTKLRNRWDKHCSWNIYCYSVCCLCSTILDIMDDEKSILHPGLDLIIYYNRRPDLFVIPSVRP